MNWVSIDFGMNYSSAAVLIDNTPIKVQPIGGLYGSYSFPTVAYVDRGKNIFVCNEALPWRCQSPERFIKDFKLDIHENKVSFLGVAYIDIVAEILKIIKRSAEHTLGGECIEGVILTLPSSYIDVDPRVTTMKSAATIAGFKEIELLKEAEAAAIYYNELHEQQQDNTTLVYDLGGSALNVAIIHHTLNSYEILGATSNAECGGKFFDEIVYRKLASQHDIIYSDDEHERILQIDSLSAMCKNVKELLSEQTQVSYPIPTLKDQVFNISRIEYEDKIKPILESSFKECKALLLSIGKQWSDINRILLIGGSTSIPSIKDMFKKYLVGLNEPQITIMHNKSDEDLFIDTLSAVSIGAIIYHKNKQSIIESQNSNEASLYDSAMIYYQGDGDVKNWILAAYYFYKDYESTQNNVSYDRLFGIYQFIVDNMSIEGGNLVLEPIINVTGLSSADFLIEILISLQSKLDNLGPQEFVKQLLNVELLIQTTFAIVNRLNPVNDEL